MREMHFRDREIKYPSASYMWENDNRIVCFLEIQGTPDFPLLCKSDAIVFVRILGLFFLSFPPYNVRVAEWSKAPDSR